MVSRKAERELSMRCVATTNLTMQGPLTQKAVSSLNLIETLGLAQAGLVLQYHPQVMMTPLREIDLWYILMGAAQRMERRVLERALVFTGVQKIPGTFIMLVINHKIFCVFISSSCDRNQLKLII